MSQNSKNGSHLEAEVKTCPNCGKNVGLNDKYCTGCGTAVAQNTGESQPAENSEQSNVILPNKKKSKVKSNKKFIAIGSVFTAVVALVLATVFVLQNFVLVKDTVPSYVLYIKNNEFYYTGIDNISPFKVTRSLKDHNSMESLLAVSTNFAPIMASYCVLSNDGSILFYIDQCSYSNEYLQYSLYYRYVNHPEKEPIKIDTDITAYQLNDGYNIVTYIKEGSLYQHNLSKKVKLASDVESFKASDDGRRIVYIDTDKNLYYQEKDDEREKIGENVSLKYISKDFERVYYIDLEANSLYKYEVGKGKDAIVSNVGTAYICGEDGIYYTSVVEKSKKPLSDYVIDDLKESDALMTEPIEPAYPLADEYNDDESFNVALDEYNENYKKYEEECSKYQKKLDRDNLRKQITERNMEFSMSDLYYFDGEKETLLLNNFGAQIQYSAEFPIMICSTAVFPEVEKTKLSEITSIAGVINKVKVSTISENYVVYKNQTLKIDCNNNAMTIAQDGSCIYYGNSQDAAANNGNLFKIAVSDGALQPPVTVAEDVDITTVGILGKSSNYTYFKNIDKNAGDLYLNSELIDNGVYGNDIFYFEKTETVAYYTDRGLADKTDAHRVPATLKIFKDGKKQTVAENVVEYSFSPTGDILYLTNYNAQRKTGDLYVFTDGKSTKIDENVSYIMQYKERKLFGYGYNWTDPWIQ